MLDRTEMNPCEHLMLWQYPPSQEVFQELLARVAPANIYLIGHAPASFDEPRAFLKRLFGLARFAINQRDGQIPGDKLTALMASDKLSVALGLAVLRKANMVDWFAEDGVINLDLLGDTPGRLDDCQEYEQLSKRLAEIKSFRQWCRDSSIKDIQLALVKNGVLLQKDSVEEEAGVEAVNSKMGQEYGNADGKNRAPGVGTASQ